MRTVTVAAAFAALLIKNGDTMSSTTYAWFLEMREGRIVVAHAFFDSVEFNELWTRVAPVTGKNL